MNYEELYAKMRQKLMLHVITRDWSGEMDTFMPGYGSEMEEQFLELEPETRFAALNSSHYDYPTFETYQDAEEDLKAFSHLIDQFQANNDLTLIALSAKDGKTVVETNYSADDTIEFLLEDDYSEAWQTFLKAIEEKIKHEISSDELELAMELDGFSTLSSLTNVCDRYLLNVNIDTYNPSVNALFDFAGKIFIEITISSDNFEYYNDDTWENNESSINVYLKEEE